MRTVVLFLFISIVALTMSITTIQATTPPQPSQAKDQWELGKQWSIDMSKEYQQGAYDSYLHQLDNLYQQEAKLGTWDVLLQADKELEAQVNTPEGKKMIEKLKIQANAYIKDLDTLKENTKIELNNVAKAYPKAYISTVINEFVSFPKLSETQQTDLDSILKLDYPIDANEYDPFEMKLRAIAKEYKVKRIILDLDESGQAKALKLPPIDKETAEKYVYALRLEEMREMLEISKSNNQTSYIQKLQSALSTYPSTVAEKHDLNYLYSFTNGIRQPVDEAEKKVAEILKNFEQKKKELFAQHSSKS